MARCVTPFVEGCSYRRAFERIGSTAQGKPERASALMRRTPWHRRVDATARGYKSLFHKVRARRLTRIMAAARTKKASAEETVAS
ncbi:hypothetical protein FF100_32100 [Methylobacterium terricola]|uniref:Transposase n=1 Tax=Methylobacterium terricola TaxID=2583531 RepID=A0A5C4L9H2_9HYPH|nr:hypothetical protein [Methylobacterium terricola]TNC07472.1 hypothetical protein FF100_32100 [Methylobacterium terricola]